MAQSIVQEKSFKVALRLVNLYKLLTEERKEYLMSKQLFHSGTSVGANVREAANAESKADFIHKMHIAQKECSETMYWLELLQQASYLRIDEFKSIYNDVEEVYKILCSIVVTSRRGKRNS